MRIKIYQIDGARDEKGVCFLGYEELMEQGEDVDAGIYECVLDADLEEDDPEDIYRKFNLEGHPLFRGRSLSTSDVVVREDGAYFCDTMGFKKIGFDESKTQRPSDLMRVLYVEPHKAPYETEIRSDLESLQKAVGGLIEPIYNEDGETCLVGNEEAKLLGMEGNRRIHDGRSIMAGPFFICGLTEDDFRSLTDEEVERYMARFAEPEDISQEEVQADTGFFIYGFE